MPNSKKVYISEICRDYTGVRVSYRKTGGTLSPVARNESIATTIKCGIIAIKDEATKMGFCRTVGGRKAPITVISLLAPVTTGHFETVST